MKNKGFPDCIFLYFVLVSNHWFCLQLIKLVCRYGLLKKDIRDMTGNNKGFSFVELMVVMFILSILAFFTIPYFVSPGGAPQASGSQALARLMVSLKRKAVQDNRDYLLHLDQVAGKVWVTVPDSDEQEPQKDQNDHEEEDRGNAQTMTDLPLSGVELLNQPDPEPSDTIIRFYSRGHSDAALIQVATEDGEAITLKLHPFLADPEIIQGHVSFHDCI